MTEASTAAKLGGMKLINLLLLALLLLLQIKLWGGDGSVGDVMRLRAAVAAQKQENQVLGQRNQALAAEVEDLKSGTEAVEERARLELGMVKPGETFYQIVHLPADKKDDRP
jgi:cell division protein FtsB